MNENDPFEVLRKASDEYAEASRVSADARNRATDALNRLNIAQRAITDMMVELKKSSPRESDWRRDEIVRYPTSE